MGFSTSGSLLLIFAALMVALGSLYSVTATTVERVKSAEQDVLEHRQEVIETDIEITTAEFDQSAGSLTLEVRNTGDATLVVNDTSITVDSRYVPLSDFETVTVEGLRTRVWRPNETLRLVDQDTTAPLADATEDHVRVVTGPGVSALKQVIAL